MEERDEDQDEGTPYELRLAIALAGSIVLLLGGCFLVCLTFVGAALIAIGAILVCILYLRFRTAVRATAGRISIGVAHGFVCRTVFVALYIALAVCSASAMTRIVCRKYELQAYFAIVLYPLALAPFIFVARVCRGFIRNWSRGYETFLDSNSNTETIGG